MHRSVPPPPTPPRPPLASARHLAALETFFRVVERRGFGAVARELGVTQPTVSRQIAALEAHLGVRLLERTTRRVTPTEAGTALFERGSIAMRLLHEVTDDVRDGQAALAGVVRVATPGALGRRLVAPALRDVLARHPHLSIDLQVTDQLVSFTQGLVDFAVRVGPQTEASLAARTVGTSSQRFVAARGYVQRYGRPAVMAELGRHVLLARPGSGALRDLFTEARRAGARIALTSGDIETLHDAVQAGVGVGLLPGWMVADGLRSRQLVACVADAPELSVPVSLVRPASIPLSRRARLVFDAVAAALAEALPTPRSAPAPDGARRPPASADHAG